jgi:hypothetical protein
MAQCNVVAAGCVAEERIMTVGRVIDAVLSEPVVLFKSASSPRTVFPSVKQPC